MDDGREDERRRTERVQKKIRTVRDLKVYRKAFDSAMEIFELTKKFPKEEKYSLTDQIRRASRSVCSNLSEGWRKRRYKAVFLNKLTDSGQEAAETQTWLEFSLRCKYIDEDTFQRLDDDYEHIRHAERDGKQGGYVLSSLILAKRTSIIHRSSAKGTTTPNPQQTKKPGE